MKQVHSRGNLPAFLQTFLTRTLPGEEKDTKVYDCKYMEIVKVAQDEKLEPQVLIDKTVTKKAFLVAVGASLREDYITQGVSVSPVCYFAELDEPRKKMFIKELQEAREKVIREKKARDLMDKTIKETTRAKADEARHAAKPRQQR